VVVDGPSDRTMNRRALCSARPINPSVPPDRHNRRTEPKPGFRDQGSTRLLPTPATS